VGFCRKKAIKNIFAPFKKTENIGIMAIGAWLHEIAISSAELFYLTGTG
jgi:hypothetical protein